MIRPWRKLAISIKKLFEDEGFLTSIHIVENLVSKVLSLALVGVILASLADLIIFLYRDLLREPVGFFSNTLIEIFGMFLNVLIALELLENITAYLRKHVVQVELVIVTALIAVARKLIIFDFSKASGIDLIGLATASFALSISYWLIRQMNRKHREERG
jgi:uncharacterized membrane protein (DUF373 family)